MPVNEAGAANMIPEEYFTPDFNEQKKYMARVD